VWRFDKRIAKALFFGGEQMKALKVGIVGGAGQVGSALLEALNSDAELLVFGICRNNVSAARIASKGMQVRITQTSHPAQLANATRDLDVLINCALPQYAPSKTSAANRQLANALASASSGKHLVHLSSVAVYGDYTPGNQKFFDDPRPYDGYGRQKLQMEQLLRRHTKQYSARCTILRVGHVYGPQLRWSEAFFDLVKSDGFRLPFDGQIPSNGVFIDNLIAGIRKVVLGEPSSATLNMVDSPQTTWRAIFDLHTQACDRIPVKALNQFDSEQLASEGKRKSAAGLAARLTGETWAWLKHLPASYIASVPAFKALAQRVVAEIGSETLDAKLWAAYCRHFSPSTAASSDQEVLSMFFSEQVPGPCLSYDGKSPIECLTALQLWHDSISPPRSYAKGDLVLGRGN
jgi:nucleoside-diphosphate-sugar epimerase